MKFLEGLIGRPICFPSTNSRSGPFGGTISECAVDGNTGLRFSLIAAMPSLSSGPVKAWNSNAREASKIGPAMRSQWFIVYLVRRIAVGGPSASCRGNFNGLAV